MKRKEGLQKLAELQAKRAYIDNLVQQETDAKQLTDYAVELKAIARQLEMLRLDFLNELRRRRAA